jgi:hypothetical protein
VAITNEPPTPGFTLTRLADQHVVRVDPNPLPPNGTFDDQGQFGMEYRWDFGDGTQQIGGQTPAAGQLEVVEHRYKPGTYNLRLQVTDRQGAVQVSSKTVTIANEPPAIHVTRECAGRDCWFDASGTTDDGDDASEILFEWTLSDGAQIVGDVFVHTFATLGCHWLDVTATDRAGATKSVRIYEPLSDPATRVPGLQVDRHHWTGLSNLNGMLEPGETVTIESVRPNVNGAVSGQQGVLHTTLSSAGRTPSYVIVDGTSTYGTVAVNALTDCSDRPEKDCYQVTLPSTVTRPAMHWDEEVMEFVNGFGTWQTRIHVGNSFSDVPASSFAYAQVEALLHYGITSGCGNGQYCPAAEVTRGQAASMLLRASQGAAYIPPACNPSAPPFADVPCTHPFAVWIGDMKTRNLMSGCGNGNFCPDRAMTRAEAAVSVLRAREGSAYAPPACTTPSFTDAPCSYWAADWIEELKRRGVTGGCGNGTYCPEAAMTRESVAVFIAKTFGLTAGNGICPPGAVQPLAAALD